MRAWWAVIVLGLSVAGCGQAAPTAIPASATATLTATAVPATDTPQPTATAGPSTAAPVLHNADWTPQIEEFDGIKMALVAAGCFMMGNAEHGLDEAPETRQCFAAPYWIGLTEITNHQYGSAGQFLGIDRPRADATWFEARDFCLRRGERLPTEAQWEYAARGPDGLLYPWGNEWIEDQAVSLNNSTDHPFIAGSFPDATSWVGALDMAGNLWEWTSSSYAPYPYDPTDGREGPETENRRVVRGGAWNITEFGLTTTTRFGYEPTWSMPDAGFRCVREDER